MDDTILATYYANILAHDPVALTKGDLEREDETNFFEIMHSAFWPHVDFTLPPAGSDAGWRVEFRPMEIQLTDFQNAALAIFMALLRQAITHFGLNFYIPIEKVKENMERSHKRDAVRTQTFHWRKDVFGDSSERKEEVPVEEEYTLMTMDQIMNGTSDSVSSLSSPGLLPIVTWYMKTACVEDEVKHEMKRYLAVIRDRVNSQRWTPAGWMRNFVQSHEEYKEDSVVSERICYDLLMKIKSMAGNENEEAAEEVFRMSL